MSSCRIEPPHDKTNIMACAPRGDADQPGHLLSCVSDLNNFRICMSGETACLKIVSVESDKRDIMTFDKKMARSKVGEGLEIYPADRYSPYFPSFINGLPSTSEALASGNYHICKSNT